MEKQTFDFFHKWTLEELCLEKLTAEELQTLLPASNQQIQKLITERIDELMMQNN